MKKRILFYTFSFLLIGTSCQKKTPVKQQTQTLPELISSSVSLINDTAAVVAAKIISDGNSEIISAGICYDTLPSPTLKKVSTTNLSVGSFTTKVSALRPNRTYYVRAYATNEIGTAYGNEITFSTPDIWARLDSSALDNYYINCLETVGETVYAGTSNGVFFSVDTGSTWQSAGLNNLNVTALAVDENVVFAGGYNFIYRSTDAGANWTKISGNLPISLVNLGDMKLNAAGILVSTFQGVFISTDNGDIWTSSVSSLPVSRYYNRLAVSDADVFVSSADNTSNTSDVHYSSDYGVNWLSVGPSTFLQTHSILGIAASANNVFISTNNSGGVYVSNNKGNTWQSYTDLPNNTLLLCNNGNSIMCASIIGKYFLSTDSGKTWKALTSKGIGNGVPQSIAISPTHIYGVTTGGYIFKHRKY